MRGSCSLQGLVNCIIYFLFCREMFQLWWEGSHKGRLFLCLGPQRGPRGPKGESGREEGVGGQQLQAIRVVLQSHCSFFRQAKNWEVANNSEKTKCFIIAFYIVKYRSMAGILHLCLTMVSLNWIKYSHEHLE